MAGNVDDKRVSDKITKGHDVMVNVLANRKMKVGAALTFWRKHDLTQLISFMLKNNDDSVFVDILPFITRCITEDERTKQQRITLGACLELFPVLERLLNKKYEMYMTVGMDMVRAIIKRWFVELRNMERQNGQLLANNSLSLPQVYLSLVGVVRTVEVIATREGEVGRRAKVVVDLFNQLR